MKTINAREIREHVSIVDLLTSLGYEPHRRSGREHIYLSMLRDSDTTPSFSVNDRLGYWYDHGLAKGGNVIDFGLLYWRGYSFREVLEKIAASVSLSSSEQPVIKKKHFIPKEPHYQIVAIRELGANPLITGYLESRGIWPAAQGRLKEVYYFVEDQQKKRRNFFAAGWQNELGAWEIRSAHFKGCLGHKAISFIPGALHKLSVFEGFMNYLSWLTEDPFRNDSILVLNSLSTVPSGIAKAAAFGQIDIFFDNDPSGHKATDNFITALPQSRDCSQAYEGYNDYNEKLLAETGQCRLSR